MPRRLWQSSDHSASRVQAEPREFHLSSQSQLAIPPPPRSHCFPSLLTSPVWSSSSIDVLALNNAALCSSLSLSPHFRAGRPLLPITPIIRFDRNCLVSAADAAAATGYSLFLHYPHDEFARRESTYSVCSRKSGLSYSLIYLITCDP